VYVWMCVHVHVCVCGPHVPKCQQLVSSYLWTPKVLYLHTRNPQFSTDKPQAARERTNQRARDREGTKEGNTQQAKERARARESDTLEGEN